MKKTILLAAALLGSALSYGQAPKQTLTPELLWQLGRVGDPQPSPDGTQMVYGVTYYQTEKNKGNADLYLQPTHGGTPLRLTNTPGSEYNACWRPDGKKIGFLSGASGSPQLYEINPDGSELRQVTSIEGGISNFRYSNTGKYVSFTKEIKLDQTVREQHPDLPKAEARVFDDLMYRHWDHWSDESYSHVFIGRYEDGKVSEVRDLMVGERFDCPQQPHGGLDDIVWNTDDTQLAYVCKKKTGKDYAQSTNTELYLYDVQKGSTARFEHGELGYDTHPAFSPDNSKIAWLGMRQDGYESDRNVLWVYDFQARKKVGITRQWEQTVNTFTWSKDGRKLYFVAPIQGTEHAFEVELPRKLVDSVPAQAVRQITQGDFNIKGIAEVRGGKLVASKQSMRRATELYGIDVKSGAYAPLTHVNDSIYATIEDVQVEKRWVSTTDGKKMLVWVVLPPNFDAKKKYPALLYCQGGPQSTVSQNYSFRWNFHLMASQGYVVVAPNRRGLPSFGEEWNAAISGDWGGQPIQDYLTAIDDVAREPYVDADRLGAVGASYGGYSVYQLAGVHNKRFKAFISHCGLFNMESWYGTTEEMFFANWEMKKPYWEYPQHESYIQFSPHRLVQKWDTPIMVIHGGKDFRVPESEGMQAFQAAQLRGIPSRFVYFPNEGHWILSPQNSLLWNREFFGWLDKWLKKPQQ